MRITIFAASGGIGRHVLSQAVAAKHDVTAVVRDPAKLSAADRSVRVVAADLTAADPQVLADAVDKADAVISGLGPRSAADFGVVSRGTRAIIAAMRATGTRRILAVSASAVSTVPSPGRPHPPRRDPGEGFVTRNLITPALKLALRRHYADLALMEDMLRDSELDWTVVRPPRLTDRPLTGVYRTAYGQNLRRGTAVPRADVAHYLLRAIDDPDSVRQAVGIAT